MGVFDVSNSELIEKPGIPGAQAYAITLEKQEVLPNQHLNKCMLWVVDQTESNQNYLQNQRGFCCLHAETCRM